MPEERLRLADYFSADRDAPDCVYSTNVAVINDYEFDRLRFRVSGDTFRSADLTHWFALDVADQALGDAGFTQAEGLPRETTGVFLGNTLTGEFSRANALRLRWPYVRRTVEANLSDEYWPAQERDNFLRQLEADYKRPFEPTGEDSLAGGLSNTIAGRICNYFDFKGGGYTVDGACASSLLAVANACSALTAGDVDAALAGGVDLSLDPFELVGFAKAGALAPNEMRVYDARSNGFWPGEGCGFVLLMRLDDARERGLRIHAVIRGWGISSDGKGGLTRPEVDGQLLSIRRAYARAGFGIDAVAYLEGHGTGTTVGDSVELLALSTARREANPQTLPAAVGSIKANIGHTKAAAGMAGLIKTAFALKSRIIPPTTGCEEPHAEFRGQSPALRILKMAEAWPEASAARAGVSSMGFGGINAHVVMEAAETETRRTMSRKERVLIASSQDAELFLLGAQSADEMRVQLDHLLTIAAGLSRAELTDLALHMQNVLGNIRVRAAVVASTPEDLVNSLKKLRAATVDERTEIDTKQGVFFGSTVTAPRVGFLFPGQGSPSHVSGGAWCRRFDAVQDLYAQLQLNGGENDSATETAQPAIATGSMAALRILNKLNIAAHVAVGHSLGELTALHWAGAMNGESLLRIARIRGQVMTKASTRPGAMASIGAGAREIETLLNGEPICIAGLNSTNQTVISGEAGAVEKFVAKARARNLTAVKLLVSQAFHSSLVAPSAQLLMSHLSTEEFKPLQRPIVSTVTGKYLPPEENVRDLLSCHITSPVRFLEAVTRANTEAVDLWLEVGPGQVLRGIMGEITTTPVVSLDAGGESLKGLLCGFAAAFVLGQQLNHRALFEGRFSRPFDLNWRPKFFGNPCELAPVPAGLARSEREQGVEPGIKERHEQIIEQETSPNPLDTSILELVRGLVAERAELPVSMIDPASRLLRDLHLNSITVSQLVAEASRHLHLPLPISPTDFADATIDEVAQALEDRLRIGEVSSAEERDVLPQGIDSWVRPYHVALVERSLLRRSSLASAGRWQVLALPDDHLVESLRQKLADSGEGNGIVLCLPPEQDNAAISHLLEAAQLVLAEKEDARFVLVQRGASAAAFARTLYLEAPRVTTCVVSVPKSATQAADWVLAEALAAEGYVEAHYDDDGRRYEPVARPLPFCNQSGDLLLSADDVLIVTGGGKGITAECALALAKESNARFVLVGQARPELDEELSINLKRMTVAGVEFRYFSVDVTNAGQVRELVETVEKELGPITGILHGAARNVPQLIGALDEEAFRRTVAVKVQGARNLLAATDSGKLKLLVTFGSIIARTGLPGEADYGLANEWLTNLTEEWKTAHPSCHCLAIEWSIWSGKGMGERLGRADRLMQQGITPIPPDEGVATLLNLLRQTPPTTPVVVMGRFRDLPTFKIERPELPFLRFLEQPRVFYPEIELVVDSDLSASTDPYLEDHIFQGERLLPAVMGLEAMTQVAMAVMGSTRVPILENIEFSQPVIVPAAKPLRIRLAALRRGPHLVDVALRSEETAFQVNHFQAKCRFEESEPLRLTDRTVRPAPLSLNPDNDLYGNVLFQSGRFRRLKNYRLLRAKQCVAEIEPNGSSEWFSSYLPPKLILGDAAARDAALHAIQACIPHMTILPVAVDRLTLEPNGSNEQLFAHATEVSRDGSKFTYHLEVSDGDGCVVERWEGLRLVAVGESQVPSIWPESLLGPYLERSIQELIPGSSISVALIRSPETDRHLRSDRAMQMALGERVALLRRPDGKPEVSGGRTVSAAHAGCITIGVAGVGPVACDVEQVKTRTASAWRDLLGKPRYELARLIARTINEDEDISFTRVWGAFECLKKTGAMIDVQMSMVSTNEGWVLVSAGPLAIATYQARLSSEESIVLAIATQAP
jgi:enediyne polyketide synthase